MVEYASVSDRKITFSNQSFHTISRSYDPRYFEFTALVHVRAVMAATKSMANIVIFRLHEV